MRSEIKLRTVPTPGVFNIKAEISHSHIEEEHWIADSYKIGMVQPLKDTSLMVGSRVL